MKRWILVSFVAAVLSVTANAQNAQLEVYVPEMPVQLGESFPVKIELTGNTGFNAVGYTLEWNHNEVEYVEARAGSLLNGALTVINPSALEGVIVATISTVTIRGNGVLGEFTFRAKAALTKSPFVLKNVKLTDVSGAPISFMIVGGTVEKSEGTSALYPVDEKANQSEGQNRVGHGYEGVPHEQRNSTQNGASGDVTTVFTDIADSWAEEYILAGTQMGLFSGYRDGSFRPGNPLTRAQFVMVLWNQAGRPESEHSYLFADMSNQIENYQKAVSWAYEKGYIQGTSSYAFSPSAPLTRQAMLKILFKYNGGVNGIESMLFEIYDNAFEDSAMISEWARPGMYWAVYNGIISGTGQKMLNPTGIVTRAHMAAIMVRYMDSLRDNLE